jgi:hypothetical protein
MADSVNKANKRQAGNTRRKLMYATQFDVTYKNKRRNIQREIETLKSRPLSLKWAKHHEYKDYTRAIDLREQELKNLDAKYMMKRR